MKLSLPADSIALADEVARQAAAVAGESSDSQAVALDQLGVLDLAGPDSPDPEHKYLDIVACLEQMARAGLIGPFAETMWVRSMATDVKTGLIAVPSAVMSPRGRLVPFGARVGSIALPGGSALSTCPSSDAEPAAAHVSEGHSWLSGHHDVLSFDQAAADFVWRAGAALTLGYMEKGLSMAVAHCRTRQQFGRTLDSFQAVSFRLAESRWRLTGLRMIIHEAGWRADRGERQAVALSALSWVYARTVSRVVSAHLHQVHGAIGFSGELGLTDITGACVLLRNTIPKGPAVQAAWQERAAVSEQPPSTVYGGFRVS